MRKLDHIGKPTSVVQAEETYMEGAKLYITDYANSPNRIEWLRFESGSEFPELLQCFLVSSLVFCEPFSVVILAQVAKKGKNFFHLFLLKT